MFFSGDVRVLDRQVSTNSTEKGQYPFYTDWVFTSGSCLFTVHLVLFPSQFFFGSLFFIFHISSRAWY